VELMMVDAFYNPVTWKNFDPFSSSHFGDTPAQYVTIDTHQFWAFPPLDTLTEPEILEHICDFGATLKAPNSGIPPTLVGEFSLSTGITANSSSNTEQDQDKRTWFRTLFEAQNAAYTPHGANQASIGWYFWAWKTEYDIDAWSYRRGIADGYIPSNVSDPSTYAFPILDTGCIDQNFTYKAPAKVSNSPSSTASSSGGSGSSTASSTASGASASSTGKSAAASVSPAFVQLGLAIAAVLMISIC
jgi:glucan 1,3-beta-glucosidase